MTKELLFNDVRKVIFKEFSSTELKPNEVRIKTLYSGISSGTEMATYRGTTPFLKKTFDPQLKLFIESDDSSWEFPQKSGYANVGEVIETGKAVSRLKKGDVVFTYEPHQTEAVVDENTPLVIPQGVKPENGVVTALLGVAYNAILDARIVLGETVVVFGLGVAGQLIIQLAKMSGAKCVIGVDLIEKRLECARQSGADITINPSKSENVAREVRKLTNNRGADVVIECSGSTFALNEAIKTAGFQSTVVTVSFYSSNEGKGLYLGEEFHHNRIKLVSSQASGVNPELSARWTGQRKIESAVELLPKLKLDNLITSVIDFEDASKAYQKIDEHPEEDIQVVLKY
jgi:2-desacetyl-2-hydroxyethyl bacteriochlorophyllide A dehydrogenase